MAADAPKPFSRARPRSEFLKRYNAMQEAKKTEEAEEDIDFGADSVIISTPAPEAGSTRATSKPFRPITNINYRGRVIDDILRREDEEIARRAVVNKKHQNSMELLRKLSRVGTPSPSQPKTQIGQTRDSEEETTTKREDITDIGKAVSSAQTQEPDFDKAAERKPATYVKRELAKVHMSDASSRRILSEPVHPKSALEAVIKEAKEGNDLHVYGDETMASLENILHPVTDATNSTFTNEPTPKQEETSERLLTQTEKDRRQERLALEAMSKRLSSTSSSLKDANKGLRRIENRIEGASDEAGPTQISQFDRAEEPVSNKASPDHDPGKLLHMSTKACVHCGRLKISLWRCLWIELRDKFYTYDASRSVHITWLGWTVVLWWIWLLTENALCTEYCNYVEGPVIPFVTLHLIIRPFVPILRPVFTFWAWIFGPIFNLLYGDLAASTKQATTTATDMINQVGHDIVWTTTAKFMAASETRAAHIAKEVVDAVNILWDD